MPYNNKPVEPKWFAGFFMLLGLIVLAVAFYDSGRLKVPEDTAHDQMGNAIKYKHKKSCESDVKLRPKNTKQSSSQQRQLYDIVDLFPNISSTHGINVILCNGSEIVINHNNYSEYSILSRHHRSYDLIRQKNKNGKANTLQIKQLKQIK